MNIDPKRLIRAIQESRTVPITVDTIEEAVARGTFRFAPPLIERSPEPRALYLEWRAFQYVFEEIANPTTFPALPDAPDEHDVAMFRRYGDAAEELAAS